MGVRTWGGDGGKWGQPTTPLEKWMKKLKSENMQKRTFLVLHAVPD